MRALNSGQRWASALSPVAITRHGKVRTILAAPGAARPSTQLACDQAARQLARAAQAGVEKDRLILHPRITIDLMALPDPSSRALAQAAAAVIGRWRHQQLCSSDYTERWQFLLNRPLPQMTVKRVSDLDDWASAPRQNSPWIGVQAGSWTPCLRCITRPASSPVTLFRNKQQQRPAFSSRSASNCHRDQKSHLGGRSLRLPRY